MSREHDVFSVLRGLSTDAATLVRDAAFETGTLSVAIAIQTLIAQSSVSETIVLLNGIAAGEMDALFPGDPNALKDPLVGG